MSDTVTRTANPMRDSLAPTRLRNHSVATIDRDENQDISVLGDESTPLESTAMRETVVEMPRIDGYELREELGHGAMGTVYLATHQQLDRTVALKVMRRDRDMRDPGNIERFAREVRALARIDHPHIVPVYDAGVSNGIPFYSMKYVAGGTLESNMDRLHKDHRAAVQLMVKVARAVHALHLQKVLHRDLKPANILVDAQGEPCVADFGLAYWLDNESDLSVTGSPLGTPYYMSPEQTKGNKSSYSTASDTWSLGVILYELLTGNRPFEDKDHVAVYCSIRTSDPPRFAEVDPTLPVELEAVVRKCLAKNPETRYANALMLAEDLERWLAGEKVTAPKVGKRFPRRRVAMLMGTAALVIGISLGVVFGGKKPATRSVADRYNSGEKVQLIGKKGEVLVPWKTMEGCTGGLNSTTEGYCTLNSKGFLAVELVSEPLQPPLPAPPRILRRIPTRF